MNIKKIIFIFLIFSVIFSGSGFSVFAQTDKEREKAELEAELKKLELEIAEASRGLTATEAEKQSLQYQINRLQGEINHLAAQINRNRVVIQSLGLKIADTEGSIRKTTEKIEKSREDLAETLRTINMEGRASVIEIVLTENNLSDVFSSLNALERLSGETKSILDEVRELRRSLQGYKEDLEGDKTETERVARIQELQKAQEEAARAERQKLYGMTEAEYQKQLAEKKELEKQADEIRQRIFRLVGVTDVEMPTFGQALEYANWVKDITGVRPAFLLSIIMQESALGRNVGQCYLVDSISGQSRNINTGQLYNKGIHPTRDLSLFLKITSEVGRNYKETPMSCYIPMCISGSHIISSGISMNSSGNPNCPAGYSAFGFGGAMGPAQFIPSTWESIKPIVSRTLGRNPDPWSVKESFLAAGILLRENGAASNELNAAARYFGRSGIGYESAVMRRASCIQTFIDYGTMDYGCSTLVFMP